jgi:hypothetical protein
LFWQASKKSLLPSKGDHRAKAPADSGWVRGPEGPLFHGGSDILHF